MRSTLEALAEQLSDVLSVFDLPAVEAEGSRLESASTAAGFWDDPERARSVMKRLSSRQRTIEVWRGLENRVDEAVELLELADDDELAADLATEAAAIGEEIERRSFELAFSGPYDDRSAVISIYAGSGGIDSQDWTEMLLRMYQRWSERAGFDVDLVDLVEGEEAGLKSAMLEVRGESEGGGAYGWLRSEHGVHRLVRISPFDQNHARHTSFARVEIMPETEGAAEVEIDDDDIKIDVYRASGNGGQNVQKNSTAVRITHLPTGFVVSCQNERSLRRNRESAMRVLEARLLMLEEQKREEERLAIRGDHIEAGWGNQIRSYVLQPYRMVKDLRTQHETSDADRVLDGDIEEFLRASLQHQIGQQAKREGAVA
ncbi:MAG: peptide chain release factor 2 [Chloroflexota bacterium]|nr:peptide chain release factor 2 [Chloroflexota bacterium]